MNDLYKIGDISQMFNITSRSLRYYEEIGLIDSIRNEETNYRYYNKITIDKIKCILLLRELTFSIKEIQQLLSSQDINIILDTFNKKLLSLKNELNFNATLVHYVDNMIKDVKSDDYNIHGKSPLISILEYKNHLNPIQYSNSIKLENNFQNIRILQLKPMKVCYYRTDSENPEKDAWNVMKNWLKVKELDQLFTTRYFGFNNPDPTEDSNIYGYEVWATINDDIQGDECIGTKVFQGGLYAVATTTIYDIVQTWQQLYYFIKNSETYILSNHQWLEEHLVVNESSWNTNMQVDLYCPIELK